jgi:glycosyltransferase involved in cell wall biosynthesis
MRTLVCFGPGPLFKGGIQNYNTSLALALDKLPETQVHIVSWTQQYPAIIPREFVDKSSKSDLLANSGVKATYLTNYNNPISWAETVDHIVSLKPEKVIFQWSIALQGLPLAYLAKKIKSMCSAEIIFDLHFVVQKENSKMDQWLTRHALRHADTFVVHALKTWDELRTLFPKKKMELSYDGVRFQNQQTVLKLYHPIYDLFRPDPELQVDALKKELGLKKHVFLFFGFIRKYKGLHHTIEAFDLVRKQRNDVSLLICGESFWHTLDDKKWSTRLKKMLFGSAKKLLVKKADDERDYRPLEKIKELGMEDCTVVVNKFIPNEDVHKYFQVADAAVLYYLTATPSGIESLSYNFSLPLLATRVGHFPETIKDGFNGYLADPTSVPHMAETMMRFLDSPIDRANVTESTKEMSWDNYAKAILR